MDTIKVSLPHTKVISDGGCNFIEIDNSYNAFLASCNRNYYGIKCDLRFTKDRVMIASRNRDLRKMTSHKIHVSQSLYDDLKIIPLKNSPYNHLVTLSEFLLLTKKYTKIACIELKPPIGNIEITQLINEITTHKRNKYCKIIASDLKYLRYIRTLDLEVNLEIRTNVFTDELFYDAIKYHLDICLNSNIISKDLVGLCHENRLKICAVANDPISSIMLSDMEVDYIYTNILEKKNL